MFHTTALVCPVKTPLTPPPRGLQHWSEHQVLHELCEHYTDKTSAVRLPSGIPQKPSKQDIDTLQWQLT